MEQLSLKHKILCITGWGGGTQLLQPLQLALQKQGYEVELMNIFNVLDPALLEHHVNLSRHYDVILGWSLGGQIAAVLVDQIEKKYTEQKVLISLGSNPCFVAHDQWLTAMSQESFEQFKQNFKQDSISTLKKFSYLVCQGVESRKSDLQSLQSLVQPQSLSLLNQGLNLLEKLNVTEILSNYAGKQLHVLAQQDALVSYKVMRNFQEMPAKNLSVEIIEGSHGFPIFKSQLISDKIDHYLQKI